MELSRDDHYASSYGRLNGIILGGKGVNNNNNNYPGPVGTGGSEKLKSSNHHHTTQGWELRRTHNYMLWEKSTNTNIQINRHSQY